MNIMRTSRVALRALARNKMRSFLTALGIIIGVGAVISMVSIGEGAKQGVQDRFNSMGTNLLFVQPGSKNAHGAHTGAGGWQTLKPEDAIAIEQQCSAVKYTSPIEQHAGPGRLWEQELEHLDPGNRRPVSGSPELGDRPGLLLRREPGEGRRQGRRPGQRGHEEPVRGRGPDRQDHPDQEHSLPGHRRLQVQGRVRRLGSTGTT